MAWGVEPRVPFLDREFLELAMGMDAKVKMTGPGRMEKCVLRDAFEGCLPPSILRRQKEQFSDGVGYSWIDGLKDFSESQVTDWEMKESTNRFPINPPQSKEGYIYRRIFEEQFPGAACAMTVPGGKSIACSSAAAIAWDANFAVCADPSGRSVGDVHNAARSAAVESDWERDRSLCRILK